MKFKDYIKSFGFSLKDLSIIPFFALTIVFILEDVRLMTVNTDLSLSQPLWLFILYTVICVSSLGLFLYYEFKKSYKELLIPLFALAAFIAFSVLSICLNPNQITISLLGLDNNPVEITLYNSNEMIFIHICSFIFFIISLFLWVTIFPKKFKNYSFLNFICYVFYGVTIFVFIYSLINDDYYSLLACFFSDNAEYIYIKDYLPISIFGNPNVFSMFLELGLFISLFHFSNKGWKIDLLFVVIYYMMIIVTLSKVAILSSTILFFIYSTIKLIISIKNKQRGNITCFSLILAFLVSLFVVFGILYGVNDNFNVMVNNLLEKIGSFNGRKSIWNICIQIVNTKPFFGLGHGIYDHLLYNATTTILEFGYINSHNAFLTILGEGGYVYLFFYVGLIIYSIVIVCKMIKKNFDVTLTLIFGLIIYLFHSCFEDLYYYVELIIVFTLICYNIYISQSVANEYSKNKEA